MCGGGRGDSRSNSGSLRTEWLDMVIKDGTGVGLVERARFFKQYGVGARGRKAKAELRSSRISPERIGRPALGHSEPLGPYRASDWN